MSAPPTALMPSGGWRVRLLDGRDAPLVGWAIIAGEVEPLLWDDGQERVVTIDEATAAVAEIYHPFAGAVSPDVAEKDGGEVPAGYLRDGKIP